MAVAGALNERESEQTVAESAVPVPEHIEVMRVIDRTVHVSARVRVQEIEYHVRNDTDRPYSILYLPLPKFALNLQITDEDGRRLNYYSNADVKGVLKELAHENPEEHSKFELRFKHVKYKLLVIFPREAPLLANSARTIILRFENRDRVALVHASLFSMPKFYASETRYPGHPHDHFFIVVGPPDYAISWSTTIEGTLPKQQVYENGTKGESRALSVRYPAAEEEPYTWQLTYTLTPGRKMTARILGIFFWVSLCLSVLLVSSPLIVTAAGWDITPVGRQLGASLSGGLAATIGILLYSLQEDWVERYKLLVLAPFALSAAAWFAWSLV